jgi:hypothetical protein
MNENEQQIAIAEFCGFVKIGTAPFSNGRLEGIKEGVEMFLPDYLHDLNAMHEAEKRIVRLDMWVKYSYSLSEKVCCDADEPLNNDPETMFGMIHATTSQRAEALLRTIGKWKDQHMKKHLTFEDGKDSEFDPKFPPPIHSSVDDFNFRKSGIGIFYMIDDVHWCDLPTSSWEQQSTTLRWIRKD